MSNKYCSRNGFTIIELMIVMAIIGVLMPLGINAFVSTRRSREVAEAAANARDVIKSARAMALSVSSPITETDWPVAYEVVFSSGNNTVTTNTRAVSGDEQYSDWVAAPGYSTTQVSSLNFAPASVSTPSCDRVVFSSVNGEMFIYDSIYGVKSSCTITFTSGNKTRTLVLNSALKQFDIE